ncbi:MAG: mechanosensitive ion channel [Bacteroidales bacterium]|nr:mechanosensitive ion channel [Bacteroidales bacterium]
MINKYLEILEKLFLGMRFDGEWAKDLSQGIGVITLLVVSFLLFLLVKFLLKRVVGNFIRKTKFQYDDYFLGKKLERRIAFLVPVYMIEGLIYAVAPDLDMLDGFIYALARIGEITTFTGIIISITDSISEIYNSFDVSKNKPMKGFMQVAKIIAIMICILLIIGVLINKDMKDLLIGLGTLSAVLMLVFKDPILGFVGGIQLTSNDMVRIGDWIVKGDADGNVIDIGLTTVKVKNWDNTIATIPTYTLISDPFINWRGMTESGGRRISRSIIIDIDTIKFCTPEMLERYKKFQLVSKYITDKEAEIAEYNNKNNVDTSTLVNGRRQTNLGIFRAYLQEYIKQNPNLNHNLTMLVRQKDPTEFGVPLQIYCFSAQTDWLSYEAIQNDIFDHVYAVVKQFDLKVYQRPSSYSLSLMNDK